MSNTQNKRKVPWWGYFGSAIIFFACAWLVLAPALVRPHVHFLSYGGMTAIWTIIFFALLVLGYLLMFKSKLMPSDWLTPVGQSEAEGPDTDDGSVVSRTPW